MQNLQLHLHFAVPQKLLLDLFLSLEYSEAAAAASPQSLPKIFLRKIRSLFKPDPGKGPVFCVTIYLLSQLLTLLSVFQLWYLVSHRMFSRFQTPHGPPNPSLVAQAEMPFEPSCFSWSGSSRPKGGGHHSEAAWNTPEDG